MSGKRKYLEVSVVANRLSLSVQSVYRLGESRELVIVAMGPNSGKRVLASSVDDFEARRLRACGVDV